MTGVPTAEQRALIADLAETLEAVPEVTAGWLAGSLGAGGGDEWSDVDLLVLVAPGGTQAASTAIAERLRERFRPVLLRPLYGGVVLTAVTPDWQRFDVSISEPAGLAAQDAARLVRLFGPDEPAPPTLPPAEYRPQPQRVTELVQEFLRILGLLPVGIGREEYALGLTGIEHLRRLTFDLMLEANAVPPSERGGALRRNPFLTDEQRTRMAAIPPLSATRESVIAGHLAFARLTLPIARSLSADTGAHWPAALEQATRLRLESALGLQADWS